MAPRKKTLSISSRRGRFRGDRRALVLLMLFAIAIAGWSWLRAHPQHNPWAPLDLRDPVGMATAAKLADLKADAAQCRAVLARSEVAFEALPAIGDGDCARSDRITLAHYPLAPTTPAVTCPVAAALELWRVQSVEPAAREILGSRLVRIEHLGAYSCRRMYSDPDAAWSEHATANAIDIAAFVMADGQRVSVLGDWTDAKGASDSARARFLREVREGACKAFATVLSPDYNAAHADHFHLDQASRWAGSCR